MGRSTRKKQEEFAQLAAVGLKAYPIRGDGNCLFNALSDQLYGDQSKHLELRHAVVRYMRENPDNFKPFIHVDHGRRRNPKRKNTGAYQSSYEDVTEEQIEAAWKEYLQSMAQDGTYGDNQEIRAFSKAYNTDVEVYQKTKEVYCFRAQEDSAARPTAYIAYHGPDYEHYSSVRKINGMPIEDGQMRADTLNSNPPSPGRYSRSGSSSIERDADSEDDDIHGPNKRLNRESLATTIDDHTAIPTIELTEPDSTTSSRLPPSRLPPFTQGLPSLPQLPAKSELPNLSSDIDEISNDKLAPLKTNNSQDSDDWAPSDEGSDDSFNLDEENDGASTYSAGSMSFDTPPPPRITIKITRNKSKQKQNGPQKKPSARDQKYLKKAAQKQARKERHKHTLPPTQEHIEQVMGMKKLYI